MGSVAESLSHSSPGKPTLSLTEYDDIIQSRCAHVSDTAARRITLQLREEGKRWEFVVYLGETRQERGVLGIR